MITNIIKSLSSKYILYFIIFIYLNTLVEVNYLYYINIIPFIIHNLLLLLFIKQYVIFIINNGFHSHLLFSKEFGFVEL